MNNDVIKAQIVEHQEALAKNRDTLKALKIELESWTGVYSNTERDVQHYFASIQDIIARSNEAHYNSHRLKVEIDRLQQRLLNLTTIE